MAEPNLASLYSQDLRSRRIRLLDLSATPRGENELRGNLKVASLDRHLTYDALSYVWGDDADSPSREIVCSGVKLAITQNCYDALCTLRRNFGVRKIWVDAICINQKDNEEKENQIPLMRDIYGKTRRTYIWLGHGTRESDEALHWIAQETADYESVLIRARFPAFPALMMPREVCREIRLIPVLITKFLLRFQPRRPYNANAMQDLVKRPWFRRMWTLQELVMANEPLVVCGTKTIGWSDLHWGIASGMNIPGNRSNKAFTDAFYYAFTAQSFWIDYYHKHVKEGNVRTWVEGDGLEARTWHQLLDFLESRNRLFGKAQDGVVMAILAARVLLGKFPLNPWWAIFIIVTRLITKIITPLSPQPVPGTRENWEISLRNKLPGVMNLVRSRQAKLPEDKVFALYGLLQELEIPLQRPDYTKSVGQVYLEFTCTLIQWHECLEMLVEASGPGIAGLPSWVPDWSKRHHRVVWGDVRAAGDSSPSFTIVRCAYDSTGDSGHNRDDFQWTPYITRNNPNDIPKIITRGYLEDKVASCLSPLQKDDELQPSEDEVSSEPSLTFLHNIAILLRWLALSQQSHFHTKPSPTSISETLFSIINSDVRQNFNHRSRVRDIFPDWLTLLNAYLPAAEIADSTAAEACARALKANEEVYSYHVERCDAIAGKRIFFTTGKGRLGTGPIGMQEGDGVALLAGLSCPVVLRRREERETYEVVGVAYVEGLMQGEAWPNGEVQMGELTLV